MSFSGQQVQQIQEALLDAYTESSLRQMLRVQMDVNLDHVAGGGNLSEIVFNLIVWAERTGNVDRLIAAAYADNPGNNLLQKLFANADTVGLSSKTKRDALPERSGGDTFHVVIGGNVSNVVVGKNIIQNIGEPQSGVPTRINVLPDLMNRRVGLLWGRLQVTKTKENAGRVPLPVNPR